MFLVMFVVMSSTSDFNIFLETSAQNYNASLKLRKTEV